MLRNLEVPHSPTGASPLCAKRRSHTGRLRELELAPAQSTLNFVPDSRRLLTCVCLPFPVISSGQLSISGRDQREPAQHGVKHTFIFPGHAWTNGRIERIFRTTKELIRRYARVFVSRRLLRRFCADFLAYYNRCRCHSAYWGFTPDEIFTESPATAPLGALSLFDGQLIADHFT